MSKTNLSAVIHLVSLGLGLAIGTASPAQPAGVAPKMEMKTFTSDMRVKATVLEAVGTVKTRRNLDYWQKGTRWALVESDPSIKTDVFTGPTANRTVWFCDGAVLLKITEGGFACELNMPGSIIRSIPYLPPVGFGYTAMPIVLPIVVPPMHKLEEMIVSEPGWGIGLIPSYLVYEGSINPPGVVNAEPLHHPSYIAGWYRMGPGAQNSQIAEMRIGSGHSGPLRSVSEKWEFDAWRRTAGIDAAFHSLHTNYHQGKTESTTEFNVQAVGIKPTPGDMVSLESYLHDGATIIIPTNGESRPRMLKYRKGATWQQLTTDGAKASHDDVQLRRVS